MVLMMILTVLYTVHLKLGYGVWTLLDIEGLSLSNCPREALRRGTFSEGCFPIRKLFNGFMSMISALFLTQELSIPIDNLPRSLTQTSLITAGRVCCFKPCLVFVDRFHTLLKHVEEYLPLLTMYTQDSRSATELGYQPAQQYKSAVNMYGRMC